MSEKRRGGRPLLIAGETRRAERVARTIKLVLFLALLALWGLAWMVTEGDVWMR